MSLLTINSKSKLTEEELLLKFFNNINTIPEKKDFFIRDFEEFYFKIRPKLAPKLIKILLEVINIT